MKLNKFYTGIGSREVYPYVFKMGMLIAQELANYGFILRSGGAEGMDTAFEQGCDAVDGRKEIYLPWKNFNQNPSHLYSPSNLAFEYAAAFHPKWNQLSDGVKKLHARNSHQVLGFDLETPSRCVICYSEGSGGTEQALRIAKEIDIPIINLFDYDSSLWDMQTHSGRKEILQSILKDILCIRYKLKVAKKPIEFIRQFKGKNVFLSNFYTSEFIYNGLRYFTVENAFQSHKTNPPSERIRVAGSPSLAKRLGKKVILRDDWDLIKDNLMLELLKAKFSQNDDLRKKLLNTDDAYLEEGNWWHDNYWGNCDCDDCSRIQGENKLGQLLMEVRELLKNPPVFCKLHNHNRYDAKCTDMSCEFCDRYYDEKRKIWWYHPESESVLLATYKDIEESDSADMLLNVDDKIKTRVVNKNEGDEYDIYIGRGSKWGNPYRITATRSREESIKQFRNYAKNSSKIMKSILVLRGKRLGCHCVPEDCHGDVLAELAENEHLKNGGKLGVYND